MSRASAARWSGSLLRGCLDHGVEPVTGTRAVRLVVERRRGHRRGAVTGPTGDRVGPAPAPSSSPPAASSTTTTWSGTSCAGPMRAPAGVPTNTGDGLRMAMRVGAQLGNMREAWWVPGRPSCRASAPTAAATSCWSCASAPCPRSIMVNRSGPAVHQRGGQLQRPRRRVPRLRPGLVPLRQPALLAGLRPGVRRRATAASAPRPGGPVPDVAHPGRLDRRARRRRSASRPTRSTQTVRRAGTSSSTRPRRRLRSRRQRLRRLVRRPHGVPRAVGDARPGRDRALLRGRADRVDARHQGRSAHRRRRRRPRRRRRRRSPACTRPATRWPARPGWSTAAPAARSGPALVFGLPGRAGRGRGNELGRGSR